ncbi:hypothetical protein RBB50_007239 [Rhinocladiella similis]
MPPQRTVINANVQNLFHSTQFSYFLNGPQADQSALGGQTIATPNSSRRSQASPTAMLNEHYNSNTSCFMQSTHDESLRGQFLKEFTKSQQMMRSENVTTTNTMEHTQQSTSIQYGDAYVAALNHTDTNSFNGNFKHERVMRRERSIVSVKKEQMEIDMRTL